MTREVRLLCTVAVQSILSVSGTHALHACSQLLWIAITIAREQTMLGLYMYTYTEPTMCKFIAVRIPIEGHSASQLASQFQKKKTFCGSRMF